MKTRLQQHVAAIAKHDETLIDLHGEGTLDGFSYQSLTCSFHGQVFHISLALGGEVETTNWRYYDYTII